MDEQHSFAVRLRELRAGAGLTQGELAKRAGLHRQGVAKLELSEREPAWSTVQALAKALGVSCEAFQTDVELLDPAPPRPRGRPKKAAGGDTRREPAAKDARRKSKRKPAE